MWRPGEHEDTPEVQVVPMAPEHHDEVLRIYQAGLDTGNASFETHAPDWAGWDARHLAAHRWCAVDADGGVLGWAAISRVSDRPVYAGVAEHSVYVDPAARGSGTGRRLLDRLVTSTEQAGVWTLQSGIFPENTASLRLHERAGFRVVGVRERLGRHGDRWRDVVFVERRAP
ncbi:MAG: N-acetyltransferase [Pseudonocardiales bacterium]|nr:MAG: N-acetyltransferase [Pseudonocardiales bacterium]